MKLKRLLTAALSAVMALSVCALPAMAEGTGTTSTLTTSTIDKNAIGSITIYKYLRNDEHNNGAGNGESFTETITPASAPLAGVGFTVYQVMDSNELMTYYNEKAAGSTVTVDTFWDSTTKSFKENVKHETTGTNSQNETWSGAEKKTDKNGQVAFDKLPVGMYLVMETTTPSVVKSPVAPFLVSIPMTRIGDSAEASTSNNLKQWLYDVKVYPKNTTVTGQVNITKKGVTGSDTEHATLLSGVQFNLYKYNDVSKKYEVCTETTGVGATVKAIVYETGANGVATATNLTKGKYYFQEIGYTDAAKKTGYIADTVSMYPFEINDNGYVVASSDTTITGAAEAADAQTFVIGTGTDNKDVTIYNYKPDFDKNVKDATGNIKKDSAGNATHDADYGIGDKVPYELTITVPANIDKLHTFKVTDKTNSNQLKYVENSVVITDSNNKTYVKGTDYTLTIDADANTNTETMTIDFKANSLTQTNLTACAGGTITIKYEATVQSGAAIAGANGNLNTADLVYSSTTKVNQDGTEEKDPYTIEDQSVVYMFAVSIDKTAQGGTQDKKGLNDVSFDLYKEATTNDKKDTAKDKYLFRNQERPFITGAAAKKLGLTDSDVNDWILVATLTTATKDNKDGQAYEGGLPAGNYKLVETKTVGGYNLLSKPVDAKLNLEYTTSWITSGEYDANGKLVKHSYKENNTSFSYTGNTPATNPSEVIKIVNRAGFDLPVTGGFGTLLFSGIGVLLVLAGVSVLFSLKKKNNRA
mgnify:CR=1 FL=1